VIFRRPGAAAAALTYAIVDRTALLTTDAAGPSVVQAAAALAPQASLAEAAAWKVARRALGEEVSAVLFVPAGSEVLRGAWPLADGLALGLSTGPGRLRTRTVILLGAREPSFRSLAADGKAAPLVARLDPRAPLAARFDGDFAALGKKLVPSLGARVRERLARRGIDLQRDVFDVLAPGGAVVLLVPPRLSLGGLTARAARTDPLRALEFEAILPLRPGSDPAAAIERIARVFGTIRRAQADGVARLVTRSGEIAWKVDAAAGRLVAAGGRPGRLDALLARLAGAGAGWTAPTKDAEAALSGGLGGTALDVGRLVEAVRALPDEAFGEGPSGFVLRSLVERVIEPAARLAAVSLRADVADGALVVALDVEAGPQEVAR
jgi:hypothetical protein